MEEIKENMVSVVVPLFNYRRYMEENILSIVNQSYDNWEVIIVDDASTDDPYPVIKPHLSDKVHYIKIDTNKGYSAAKNVGVRASHGGLIVVLDADDMLSDDSLKLRVDYMEAHKDCYWVHGKSLEFHDPKPYEFKLVKRKSYKRFKDIQRTGKYALVWTCIHAQTVMVRRCAYKKVGLYEETLRSMGDKEMWARLLHHVGKPGYVDNPIALYRQHDKQMHRSRQKLKNVPDLERRLNNFVKSRSGRIKGVEQL